MKRVTILLTLSVVLLTACSSKGNIQPNNTPAVTPMATVDVKPSPTPLPISAGKVSDYIEFVPDVHMKYKGTGNEYAEYETYVDYVKDGVMQIRSINGGTTSAVVYQLKDGALKKVYTRGEVYYRYDYTSQINRDEIIIKEPIKEGTSWALDDGSTRSITAVDKEITVPAGSYKALEVTTKSKNSTEIDYYVRNIGHVKREYKSNDGSFTVTSELEKFEKKVPLKQRVRFYFPEFNKDRVAYVDRDVEMFTNQDIKLSIQDELKTPPENSGLTKTLSANTQILGYSIDEKNATVTIDFSSHLISEMNAGTSLESMLLKSIVNTFGDYFQKDKVIITIEGKPYESGHILLKPGEYLKVSKNNIAEYKKQ